MQTTKNNLIAELKSIPAIKEVKTRHPDGGKLEIWALSEIFDIALFDVVMDVWDKYIDELYTDVEVFYAGEDQMRNMSGFFDGQKTY